MSPDCARWVKSDQKTNGIGCATVKTTESGKNIGNSQKILFFLQKKLDETPAM